MIYTAFYTLLDHSLHSPARTKSTMELCFHPYHYPCLRPCPSPQLAPSASCLRHGPAGPCLCLHPQSRACHCCRCRCRPPREALGASCHQTRRAGHRACSLGSTGWPRGLRRVVHPWRDPGRPRLSVSAQCQCRCQCVASGEGERDMSSLFPAH
ncbi:uncharacterized protein B0I36DRAFT_317805 [Microdochium trichocladiopsis]|uniref:Uncharacterized protein n=1 Tax=Microdochium trichocladiopsis TaxID=1682393 RepID=A0A9P8YDZ8_9PEZI|nr:uncharacterized protein B0I36DRAFT_317805 [Microdochium trichocladiopsis]KAH7035187.1 hypothetical protein B0I36DRAFT_317805 [Microdochium trichocladiopsis]